MRRLLITASLLVSGLPLQAAETCVTLDNKAVAALFDDLNFALSSLDAKQVTQRYWPNALLLPPESSTPRVDAAAISDYYTQFLVKRPRGHIDTRAIQTGCNMAVDMGTYTFSLMDDKGSTTNESARYTIIYQYRDGAWKILNQQSSAIPEASATAAPDARLAGADASAPAKATKAEAASPPPRKERRPKRKDYLDDVPVAAKPVEKPAAAPLADAKPAADAKAAAESKANPEVKAPAGAKVANDAKPAADAKASANTKPAPNSKATPVANATPATKPTTEAAPAADAKLPPEVRTTMFANLFSSPPPSKFYPPEAMRHKEHGSVNLKVCASGDGAVSENMEVLKSSGSKLLDEAAMTWARNATWVPATYNRQRVEGCAKVDVSFEPPPELSASR